MQWYVTSVSRGSLYEKVGNKCMKILKFWRTELSYGEVPKISPDIILGRYFEIMTRLGTISETSLGFNNRSLLVVVNGVYYPLHNCLLNNYR
jgi:hypothetical protein